LYSAILAGSETRHCFSPILSDTKLFLRDWCQTNIFDPAQAAVR
jgi:hypothetical protein